MRLASRNPRSIGFVRPLRRLMRSAREGVSGVSAIEFAIITPLMILTAVSMFDFGTGFYRRMQVEGAAGAGAQYAIAHGFDQSAITTAILSATNFPGLTASPAPFKFCGCASSGGISTVTCGSTCPGGASAGTYVTISAQGIYTTLVPYPGIPSSYNFTAQSTVRIQ